MNILGLGGSGHSFSACLLKNGEIEYAIEEERLNRVNYSLLPDESIHIARSRASSYCLKTANIPINQVDLIIGNDLMNELYYSKFREKILLINHHLSHASSCYFTSEFDESAILVIDSRGSNNGVSKRIQSKDSVETISYYYGDNNKIKEIGKTSGHMIDHYYPTNSIGEFYDTLTRELGFDFLNIRTTMELSSYGNNKYVQAFEEFYNFNSKTGTFKRTIAQIKKMKLFIRRTLNGAKNDRLLQERANIAFAGQYHLEKIVIGLANLVYKKTQTRNICLSGGIFLNNFVNTKVLKETPFKNVYIFPAAGDSGLSIGSALYGFHVLNNRPKTIIRPFSPYLGKEYEETEIQTALRENNFFISYHKPLKLYEEVSKLLASGKIVGWFQGRAEFGSNTLGNRSILISPQSRNKNLEHDFKGKEYDPYKPYTISALENHQIFELESTSHYGMLSSTLKKDIISIPGMPRALPIHTINKSINYKFYKLVSQFYNKTNIPYIYTLGLCNNHAPIVESPIDAVKLFLNSKMDILVMDDYLIKRT
ncbi:carbamoyltransferase N-terminal domain-containing protein [Cytobacillus solani]|uniref:carbamoyltransferase N-terminal domain-containing protein n=1 Tax=Cytobacillus solani TaxID=1637975 RepID=UPI0011527F12|nr:carbamoyltransferase N-terminal domain-containing protein [Cytobacillus solani]